MTDSAEELLPAAKPSPDVAKRIGRPPKVDADGVPTRERLLAAGAAAFVEQGFEATTLVDLAKRADVSPPAIYNHFADKDEVLVSAAQWALSKMRGDRPGPGFDDPQALVVTYLAPEFADTRRLLLELHLAALRRPRVSELLQAWHVERATLAVTQGQGSMPELKTMFLLLLGLAQIDAIADLGVERDEIEAKAIALANHLLPGNSS